VIDVVACQNNFHHYPPSSFFGRGLKIPSPAIGGKRILTFFPLTVLSQVH
jgi:hypothetical protein